MNRKARNVIMPPLPKRFSELIALISVSTTIFLFLHTQSLTARIEEIQGDLTAAASAAGSSAHENQQPIQAEDATQNQVKGKSPQGFQTRRTNVRYNVTALNNTRNAVKETLFFNRVPKVGSQTIMDLMQRLASLNNFQFHRDGTQKGIISAFKNIFHSRLTTMIDMFTPPSTYVKHTCFSNFTRHGYPMPIYMNFVRDPIERVISWFYYIRAPWYIVERKQAFPELPLPAPFWLKKDFELCVRSGDRECLFIPGEYHDGVGDHRRQAMFFCGHDERCVEFNGEWAVQQAKRHVEENYAVVGVLEEMDITLQVLEGYIPRFFKGAPQVYYDNIQYMKRINKNIYKPPVSQEVKDILRQNFTREIEFYEFCKQRLYNQYNALLQLREDEQRLQQQE
ncbi:unnamed protein product [Allacma fusca]|uniref:Heparan sulfate 2-O-sulfotransferase pipe n=1 Tax=Allacma fusca TaxID=39272 RepID=A0A8J2LRR2_9HEXA|nr:unnamed protein product [Allacma fusca]